jgi:hypothetical protein
MFVSVGMHVMCVSVGIQATCDACKAHLHVLEVQRVLVGIGHLPR